MKISTKLRLAVYVPAFMAVVILVALVFSYQESMKIHVTGDTIRQIRTSITEINHFVFSYILYHEERPKQQFLEEHSNLTKLITGVQVNNSEQQRLIENIRDDSSSMKDLFLQLVSNHEGGSTAESGYTQGTEDRLVGSLLLRSYEADSDAALLRNLVDDGIRITQARTTGLIVVVLLLATIPLTFVLARTRRGIISSLTKLGRGTAIIGSGNLDFRIEEKGTDEIGDLSRAFNRMTSDLKNVTASKEDLEKEVDERKKAEAAVRASEQRWATTLSSIGDGVIATDNTGRITFMNAVAESLTGWKLSETSGEHITEIFHIINEKTRQVVENPVTRVIQEGITTDLASQTMLVRKDGTTIPVDISGAPIIDPEGFLLGVVLVFRDITERKKTEQIKDEFIGLVSHELRTPLTVIIGGLATAMDERVSQEDKEELVKEASFSAGSLAGILDNMLELSRYQAGRLKLDKNAIDIADVASKAIQRVRRKYDTHEIVLDIPGDIPEVSADAIRIEQVFYNLIENAVKYSPAGSKVRIFCQQGKNGLVVGVSDQGAGISPTDQPRLFEPFTRLEVSGAKGIGLGLVVCKRLVEAHDGRLWVESQPGKGSTFLFTIP